MSYRVVVGVRLKEGLLDPQGKAVEAALPSLGWTNVSGVRVGKEIELELDAPDEAAARAQVVEMSERFLSNPVIETFEILRVSEIMALSQSNQKAT
ncbi:MAG TPA: phosphoribosylformylglycinamidine synthase subunit PurS [Actinomycetota bacterium]|nr:phosphoribosylformylglycinamidine synthase subunit PurS [Actinomycetota bacterium]